MDIPNGLSWSLRKVWAARDLLDANNPHLFTHGGNSGFRRLATRERLLSWNINVVEQCGLCQNYRESISHMFFECGFSNAVWNQVLLNCGFVKPILTWQEEIEWANKLSRSTRKKSKVGAIAFVKTVYAMWLQRNANVFNSKLESCDTVISRIMFAIACRCSDEMKSCLL
nr:uncharacterized protein LOC110800053 [Spinacia oleracea]